MQGMANGMGLGMQYRRQQEEEQQQKKIDQASAQPDIQQQASTLENMNRVISDQGKVTEYVASEEAKRDQQTRELREMQERFDSQGQNTRMNNGAGGGQAGGSGAGSFMSSFAGSVDPSKLQGMFGGGGSTAAGGASAAGGSGGGAGGAGGGGFGLSSIFGGGGSAAGAGGAGAAGGSSAAGGAASSGAGGLASAGPWAARPSCAGCISRAGGDDSVAVPDAGRRTHHRRRGGEPRRPVSRHPGGRARADHPRRARDGARRRQIRRLRQARLSVRQASARRRRSLRS